MISGRIPRGISTKTIGLLEEVERLRNRWFGPGDIAPLTRQVTAAGEPRAILYLRELLVDRRWDIADAAADAVLALFALVGPRDAVWFDELMRHGWLPSSQLKLSEWGRLKPLELNTRAAELSDSRAALFVNLSHPNGFIREATVDAIRLGRLQGALLPVLVRLRDWIPQVRSAAWECLQGLLHGATDEELLNALALALRLERGLRRNEVERARQSLLDRLHSTGGLEAGARWVDPVVRRCCLAELLRVGADPGGLARLALDDPDPLVQEWLFPGPLHFMGGEERMGVLEQAANATRARVRNHALRELWHADPSRARPVLMENLLAQAATVRELAIWILENDGSLDSAGFYRGQIGRVTGRALVSVVAELGRRGDSSDTGRIESILQASKEPRLHAAALRALGRLAPDAATAYYMPALRNGSRRIARTARDLLVRDRKAPRCKELSEVAGTGEYDHSRLYALTVIRRRCPKWFRLIVMMELVAAGDEPLAVAARVGVQAWLVAANRSTVTPTQAEAAQVTWLASRCRNRLPSDTLTQIIFHTRQETV